MESNNHPVITLIRPIFSVPHGAPKKAQGNRPSFRTPQPFVWVHEDEGSTRNPIWQGCDHP